MLYLVVIICIFAIIFTYYILKKNNNQERINIGIPNWQPTVCDPFYQNCWGNLGWTYSDGYFYPLFVKNI